MSDHVAHHITSDGVMRIVIRRPETRNALTKEMYGRIRELFRSAYLDDSVRAVVIEGSEGAFASGGDLREILDSVSDGPTLSIFDYDTCIPFEAIRSLPKPTIAAIDGLCLGGGLTMASVCDIVIATSSSRFSMPESRVGVVDGHLPRLLREQIPPARLRYWLYTGSMFSADDAWQAGLLTSVVPDGELEPAVDDVLRRLGQASATSIRAYKRILNETRHLAAMEDAYETLVTDEVRHRLQAFDHGEH